jgi:hypothetical protein
MLESNHQDHAEYTQTFRKKINCPQQAPPPASSRKIVKRLLLLAY